MNNVKLHPKHSFWLSAVLVLALAMTACGGSGSDPEPPPPPTALPNSLSLVLPATRQAIATDVAFSATYITADGGGSWRVLTSPPSAGASSGTAYDMARDGTVFARSSYGYAGIEYTTDLGTTWRTMPLPTITGNFSPVWAYDSRSRVLAKDLYGGRAYLTNDAGLG